ncbi:preprotein translocase subunit SecY [Bradyrhizobium liaoningense]
MNRELARRIAFTIGALLLFRLGTQIPIAGLDVSRLSSLPDFNGRLSLFSLGLIPYLTAAIFVRLLSSVWRGLSSLERSGEDGRRKVARATLGLTLALAAFQAYGISSALISIPQLVRDPDGWFVMTATASMIGGVFVLVWLSEQITRYGIGNGLALILSVGMLASLPRDVAGNRRCCAERDDLRQSRGLPRRVLGRDHRCDRACRRRTAKCSGRVRRAQCRRAATAGARSCAADQAQQRGVPDSPAGHFKFLRVWSVKFLHPRGRTRDC